jgi:mono/diheme cytochrome c family protein
MKALSLLASSLLALALSCGAAVAAGVPAEVDSGHELARAWCTSCHAVEPGEIAGPYADVPSFLAVARLPSTTQSALHAFLSSPHRDMPDIKFTDAQLDDIVGYILSLRGK